MYCKCRQCIYSPAEGALQAEAEEQAEEEGVKA